MEPTNQENARKRRETIRRRKREQRRQFIAVTVICCVVFFISLQLVTTSADFVVTETLPSSVDEQIESEVDLDEIETDVIASAQMRRMALVEEVTVETVAEEETAEEAEEKEVLHGWMEYTSDDVELLAKIMYAEEGVLYKMYVDTDPEDVEMVSKLCGSVVLHRLANEMGGATTIEEVLYNCSNGIEQYASQTKDKVEEGQDVPEIFFTWAEQLLQGGPLGPNNLVFQAEFEQGEVYAQYWNQIFCLSKYLPETEED